MSLALLHFIRPAWLLWALPAVLVLWQLRRRRQQHGDWASVIEAPLLAALQLDAGHARHRSPLLPLALAWLLACLALAGPSWERLPQPLQQSRDALVILLDLSASMYAEDVAPSRLQRAQQKVLDLLALRTEGQTALIAYAGDAHVVTPLTDDRPTIANLVPALSPGIMPVPGSDPVTALARALELLQPAGGRGKLLLITDDVTGEQARAMSRQLSASGLALDVLAVGSESGAPIPLPAGGFLKDAQGDIAIPRLPAQALRELAAATGGSYQRVRADDSDLLALLSRTNPRAADDLVATSRETDQWDDKGYWLVLAMLPLCLLWFRRGWLLALGPLLLLSVQPPAANAAGATDWWLTPDQQAQQALQNGDAEAAAALFKNRRWKAQAAYEAGDYDSAAQLLNAAENADDWYNLGNSLARSGELDAAVDAYTRSLELQPDQTDASDNLALVKQLRDQQQQQQQQPQQQDQSSAGDEQQPGDDSSENQDGPDQGENPGDQQQDSSSQSNPSQQAGEQSRPDTDPAQESESQASASEAQPDGTDPTDTQGSQQPESDLAQSDADPDDTGTEARPGDEPQDADQGETQALTASQAQQQAEEEQALEQWLRRVPDDPAGLLRQKFRYESEQRRANGRQGDASRNW